MTNSRVTDKPDSHCLHVALDRLTRRAQGSKWRRLLAAPGRYLYGQFFRHLFYRYTHRGIRRRAVTFFGYPLWVMLPAGMDIYLLGGKSHDTEIRLARFLLRTLQPGDTFVDVGAHFGYFSLLASRLVGPAGRVVAIEAATDTFQLLSDNTDGHTNITAHHLACSERDGETTFYEFPALYSEYNTLHPEQFSTYDWAGQVRKQVVRSIRLDTFLQRRELLASFIKIDVEGAEADVIAGLPATLSGPAAPLIALEYLSDKRHNTAHRTAAARLEAVGYRPYLIAADGVLRPIALSEIAYHLQKQGLESENIIFKPS